MITGLVRFLFITILLMLAACTQKTNTHNMQSDKGVLLEKTTSLKEPLSTSLIKTDCVDPRPQMCTMIYLPVCGKLKEGADKTYASQCVACSDLAVVSAVEGACK